jgi:hypothetical protein
MANLKDPRGSVPVIPSERDCAWNETVVRFHRPATIPVKHLEITTGDTVDRGTSSIIVLYN